MIDEDLDKKIRNKQARMIQQESETVSFSKVVNLLVREGLKTY